MQLFPSAEALKAACNGLADLLGAKGQARARSFTQRVMNAVKSFGGTEFPARIVAGIRAGAGVALFWACFACTVAFRAWRKKFINHHNRAHVFLYSANNTPFELHMRFVAIFVSFVAWGWAFIAFFFTIIATLSPWIGDLFTQFWPFIVSYLVYVILDFALLRKSLLPRFVVNKDKIIDVYWFRFCTICLELFYFPFSLFSGLSAIIMLLLLALAGFLRPDICIMPAGLEGYDLGHATFVSAVRFHHKFVYGGHEDDETFDHDGGESLIARQSTLGKIEMSAMQKRPSREMKHQHTTVAHV